MRLLNIFAGIALLPIIAFGSYVLYWHMLLANHAAAVDRIFAHVRTWRLHRTDGAAIKAVADEYKDFSSTQGDCTSNCTVSINFALWPKIFEGDRSHKFGIRPTTYAFVFGVQQGKFSYVFFQHHTVLPSGEGLLFRIMSTYAEERRYEGDSRTAWGRVPRVTSPPPGTRALDQVYVESVTDDEWEQIMRFNSDCASRWSPCKKLRDYMPTAWQQYADWARAHNWHPIVE